MGPGMFDGLGKTLATVAAVGAGACVAVGFGGAKLMDVFSDSAAIEIEVSERTMDMAKYGQVDAAMICAETIAFQSELAETLADQENGDEQNTKHIMSIQDCLATFE